MLNLSSRIGFLAAYGVESIHVACLVGLHGARGLHAPREAEGAWLGLPQLLLFSVYNNSSGTLCGHFYKALHKEQK